MGDQYLLAAGVFALLALVQVALRLARGSPPSGMFASRARIGMVLAPVLAVIFIAAWLIKRL